MFVMRHFAGAMAISFVLPELGKIYDEAKVAKAGARLRSRRRWLNIAPSNWLFERNKKG